MPVRHKALGLNSLNSTGSSRLHRLGAAFFALILVILAAVIALPVNPAQAAGRTSVTCYEPGVNLECSEERLRQLITEAGTTPTRIVLGFGSTYLTSTLTIPAGADIEIVNYPDTAGSGVVSSLTREPKKNGFPLVSVAKGATLTLNQIESGALEIDGNQPWGTGPLMSVAGKVILEAGVLTGAREVTGFYRGGITVIGADASFIMNGGKIIDNWRQAGTQNQFGAGNVAVTNGATFTMNGGEISAGRGSETSAYAYGEVGGIGVYSGGHLVMNGGIIKNNQGWAGGILAMTPIWNKAEALSGGETNRSTVAIKGGTIDSNTAGWGGGGLSLFENVVATMSGGTISNNSAPNGGGVNTFDYYMAGADNTYAPISGIGKDAGFTMDEWTELVPAAFTMTGGTIANNRATRTGGGINIVSNAVYLKAGTIKDNTANQQGGGIYVATAPYVVKMEHALITANAAGTGGGGIWTCPTGELGLHVTNGGAVYDNKAGHDSTGDPSPNAVGDDIAQTMFGYTGSGPEKMWLADRMLGGGRVAWYLDERNKRFDPANPGEPQNVHGVVVRDSGFVSVASDAAKRLAKTRAKLTISGNSAGIWGGGIGSNGAVQIGHSTKDVTLKVNKTWAAGIGATEIPAEIVVNLVVAGEFMEPIVLRKGEDWSGALHDLPADTPVQAFAVLEGTVLDLVKDGETWKPTTDPAEQRPTVSDISFSEADGKLVAQAKPAAAVDQMPIQLTLLVAGKPNGVPVILSPQNNWTASLPLPADATAVSVAVARGQELNFAGTQTVIAPSGVTTETWFGMTDAERAALNPAVTVDNSRKPATTSFTGKKIWVGGSEPRPNVILQLERWVKGGEPAPYGDPVTLKSGTTSHEWTGLPLVDGDGKIWNYRVTEPKPPTDYRSEASADGTSVTNTWVPPKTPTTSTSTPPEPEKPGPKLPRTGTDLLPILAMLLAAGLGYQFYRRSRS